MRLAAGRRVLVDEKMPQLESFRLRISKWAAIVLILALGVVLDFRNEGPIKNTVMGTPPEDVEVRPQYQLIAFDRTGSQLAPSALPFKYSRYLESTTALAEMLHELAEVDAADPDVATVVALGSVPAAADLSTLAQVVDAFLAPRMEWRIVAERFEAPNNKNGTTRLAGGGQGKDDRRGKELFYDPAIHAPEGAGTFAEAAGRARHNLLLQLRKECGGGSDEELLERQGVDFLLVRVLEEKLAALSGALRRYQFPEDEKDCSNLDEHSFGRTFVRYGGHKDFLGASTINNIDNMMLAIRAHALYVEAAPPIWGRVYHFESCTEANGIECAFLPIVGGKCVSQRVHSALECLSKFEMGSLQMIVLPKDGIPPEVCEEGREQLPAPLLNTPLDEIAANGPPEAFVNWCPQCGFGGEVHNPSPEVIADPTTPLSFEEIKAIDKSLPFTDYLLDERGDPDVLKSRTCTMELPPLKCGDRTCCYDEVTIPQNELGKEGGSVKFISSALGSFMTRFNRASRRRIARLHQPRITAMTARNLGWELALATGSCVTLHIRRGDNIDRCREGEEHFCSMDLTLNDYMEKAVPMLAQLNESRHVFVMTDDAEVATDDKLAPWQEKGYFLEVISGHNQYSQETYDDWDPFLESLYTAQACRAVVGHHISTVSRLIVHRMCARWGECPIEDMMRNS